MSATTLSRLSALSQQYPRLRYGLASWAGRWFFLAILLIAERTFLWITYSVSGSSWHLDRGTLLLLKADRGLSTILIGGATATVLLSWPRVRAEFLTVLESPARAYPQWIWWLLLHAMAWATSSWMAALMIAGQMPAPLQGPVAVWVRSALIIPGTIGWALALLPLRFWSRWLTSSPAAFAGGLIFGFGSWVIRVNPVGPWSFLQASTFRTVAELLRVSGQKTWTIPGQALIGTTRFSVRIEPPCMGLEGVGVIVAFLTLYFFLCRRTLRFPRAFALLPVAVILMWFLNCVRIAALILLGGWNQQLAVRGFHSQAGWLLVNATAFGLVLGSQRVGLLIRPDEEQHRARIANPAAMYLVPLLAMIATAMLSTAFSGGFNYLYPLKVLAGAGALWFYGSEIASLDWKPTLWAIAPGVLVFILWIALASYADGGADAAFSAGLASMSVAGTAAWLSFRIIGAIVLVPIAEELAFRGYLVRKLIADDFEAVPFTQFAWLSFIASSILFGALHEQWLAGTLAGMIFAATLYRRGSLADAVVAHSTSNALLCAYVLLTHHWFLWN